MEEVKEHQEPKAKPPKWKVRAKQATIVICAILIALEGIHLLKNFLENSRRREFMALQESIFNELKTVLELEANRKSSNYSRGSRPDFDKQGEILKRNLELARRCKEIDDRHDKLEYYTSIQPWRKLFGRMLYGAEVQRNDSTQLGRWKIWPDDIEPVLEKWELMRKDLDAGDFDGNPMRTELTTVCRQLHRRLGGNGFFEFEYGTEAATYKEEAAKAFKAGRIYGSDLAFEKGRAFLAVTGRPTDVQIAKWGALSYPEYLKSIGAKQMEEDFFPPDNVHYMQRPLRYVWLDGFIAGATPALKFHYNRMIDGPKPAF